MKNLCKAILYVAVILIVLAPLQVYADSPGSAAFPQIDELFGEQSNSPYFTQYQDNYYLDIIDVNGMNVGGYLQAFVNTIANIFFIVQYYMGLLLVSIFYYSFEIDIYKMFSGLITNFTSEMKTALFDELSLMAICLLGVYFVIMMIKNQRTQIWVAILQTILMVALATFFYTSPMKIPQAVDSFSKEISKSILTGSFKTMNSGQEPKSAVVAACSNIWYIFVHQPWQMLEFGNFQLAKQHEARILTMTVESKERKAYIKDLAKDNEHFTLGWGAKRLGLMLVYFIPMLIIFVVICLLSLLMLGYQFLTVLYTMLGVFVFILALIPFFGPRLVQNWFFKIIGTGGIKIVISFCLGIVIVCISILFSITEENDWGWMVTLFLEVVIVLMIIYKKDSFIEMFTSLRLAPENPKAFQNKMMQDVNIEQRVSEFARNRRMNRGSGDEDSKSSYDSSFKRSSYSRTENKKDTRYEATNEPNEGAASGLLLSPGETGQDNDNLRQLMKKAEDILEKMYDISKASAEEKAELTGNPPEYSELVNKVDTREKLGAPKFDQREIQAMANEIQKVERAGGSAEDIVKVDKKVKDSDVQRPSSVMSIANEPKEQMTEDATSKETAVIDYGKLTQEYTEEFNDDYNKTYEISFMQGLTKKYGHANVRNIMDNMKEKKSKDGDIANPAGYLTQSLKNRAKEQARQKALDQAIDSNKNIKAILNYSSEEDIQDSSESEGDASGEEE